MDISWFLYVKNLVLSSHTIEILFLIFDKMGGQDSKKSKNYRFSFCIMY